MSECERERERERERGREREREREGERERVCVSEFAIFSNNPFIMLHVFTS